MNKVLVIGASGFLGQAIVKKFQKEGISVGALSRSPIFFDNKLVTQYAADILDSEEIESIISKHDIIINCTGQISNPIHQCLIQNTDGIQNIVCLLYTSPSPRDRTRSRMPSSA